jgi:hypothetical protein
VLGVLLRYNKTRAKWDDYEIRAIPVAPKNALPQSQPHDSQTRVLSFHQKRVLSG